jgi:SAM-dependent methyltransferase
MKAMEVVSPISSKKNVVLVKKIKSDEIIALYRKAIGLEISSLKDKTDEVDLYKCQDSGYSFYYPAESAGDGMFYEELSKQPWYYSEDRWEHRKAMELVPDTGSLLEMGCGSGFFLQMLKKGKPNLQCTGLEINNKAIAEGKASGLNIIGSDVIDYSKAHKGELDFVCSFQVMEHIYNVREVLIAQIELLKSGGKLLIGVPNNESYVGRNKHLSRCLNMPPHHMGLWDNDVFAYIAKEFNLRQIASIEAPFFDTDYTIYHYNHILKILKSSKLTNLYFKMGMPNLFKGIFLKRYKKKAHGHTILALFQK